MVSKLLFAACLSAAPALAWDRHQALTQAALEHEKGLDEVVKVTSVEEYLKATFGAGCTLEKAKETIFDGVGRDFVFFYQSNVPATFKADWVNGNNLLTLDPKSAYSEHDPNNLGGSVVAKSVIATYSDEPDWKMDDDVPRLAKANVIENANSGTATRALRHFWTPGEEMLGIELGKGQETDVRAQLYYELALIAFESNQPYWGYRLLGNAVHYIQDMSQPFHVLLVINNDMLDFPAAIHRLICDVDRNLTKKYPTSGALLCKNDETLSAAVIDSAWYVGTYHAIFEEFALALLQENGFATREFVSGEAEDMVPLAWRKEPAAPLNVKSIIAQTQTQILTRATQTGEEVVATFGRRYVRNRPVCEQTLIDMGHADSREYKMGQSYYLIDPSVTIGQFQHRAKLLALTNSLLRAGSTWTRQFIRQATGPRAPALKSELKAMKARLSTECSRGSGARPKTLN